MKSKCLIIVACALALVACQSHQLPKAKGKWVAVNADGFIPQTVTKYSDSTTTLTQDVDNSNSIGAKE